MSPLQIHKVESCADHKTFVEFPWTVYRDDPNWTPPLLSMRRDTYDKTKNPAWEYLTGDFFIVRRDGRPVGTTAAYINHRHNEFHNERLGWFGAFECMDDDEAAALLLKTAVDWVRDAGYDAVRGPQTFTTHEECGLLIDGFTRPVLLYPYNPPYYQRLIEASGFHKVADAYGFYLNRDEAYERGTFARLKRLSDGIMKRNTVSVRPIDRSRLNEEFALFKELYNSAWEKNWGFVPMTPRELDGLIRSLVQFFDPRLAYFAYVDGEPAGFALGVPDFNQVLHQVRPRPGVPEIFSMLHAGYLWKIRNIINWARVPLMGVRAEYRRKGVDAVLYYYMLQAMIDAGYYHNDSGWILEQNLDMVKIARSFGSDAYKTYRFYERAV